MQLAGLRAGRPAVGLQAARRQARRARAQRRERWAGRCADASGAGPTLTAPSAALPASRGALSAGAGASCAATRGASCAASRGASAAGRASGRRGGGGSSASSFACGLAFARGGGEGEPLHALTEGHIAGTVASGGRGRPRLHTRPAQLTPRVRRARSLTRRSRPSWSRSPSTTSPRSWTRPSRPPWQSLGVPSALRCLTGLRARRSASAARRVAQTATHGAPHVRSRRAHVSLPTPRRHTQHARAAYPPRSAPQHDGRMLPCSRARAGDAQRPGSAGVAGPVPPRKLDVACASGQGLLPS